MRTRLFFALLLLLSLFHDLRAQEVNLAGLDNRLDSVKKHVLSPIKYQISYEYAYRLDSKDTFDVRREPMLLQLGDSHLRFVSVHLYAADTIKDNAYHRGVKSFLEIMGSWQRALRSARFKEQWVCDLTKRELWANIPIVLEQWSYTEELPQLSWELAEGDSTILGYTCHRATTSFRGRNYVAYYSPEIPLPYGPWKFGGLPGLILYVGDDKGEHVYTAVGLEELKEYMPLYQPIFEKAKKASRKEILGMQANFAKNPAMVLGNLPGVKVAAKDLAELKPRPYNPQELE